MTGRRRAEPANTHSQSILRLFRMREMGVMIPLLVLAVLIGLLNPTFFHLDNLVNILRSTSFAFIVGIGMTMVLISAGLDLSIGSVFALGGCATGYALVWGLPLPFAILFGMLAGMLIGLINGLIIVRIRIPTFITTLGMLYMARGLVLVTTQGVPIYPLPDGFLAIGQESIAGLPYVVWIAFVLGIAADFMLRQMTYGRAIYAIGGNEETARLSGIRVNPIKLSLYVTVGMLAAFAGILQSARLGSGQPNLGQGFELEVIAAVIIGGTSLFGGAGTILGTFLGALFLTVLKNGMSMVHIRPDWQQIVIGLIIVIAAGIDQWRRKMHR